jgi:hypothetical protein
MIGQCFNPNESRYPNKFGSRNLIDLSSFRLDLIWFDLDLFGFIWFHLFVDKPAHRVWMIRESVSERTFTTKLRPKRLSSCGLIKNSTDGGNEQQERHWKTIYTSARLRTSCKFVSQASRSSPFIQQSAGTKLKWLRGMLPSPPSRIYQYTRYYKQYSAVTLPC